jgi:hypothetical protein
VRFPARVQEGKNYLPWSQSIQGNMGKVAADCGSTHNTSSIVQTTTVTPVPGKLRSINVYIGRFKGDTERTWRKGIGGNADELTADVERIVSVMPVRFCI